VAFVMMDRGFHSGEPFVDVVGQSLAALFFGALVVAAVLPRGRVEAAVRRGLSVAWLRFFGTYSYAIYVFHATLHRVARVYLVNIVNRGGTMERLSRLVIYDLFILAASTLLALVSWHLLEKHFLRLKDRLAVIGPAASTLPAPLPVQTSRSFAADS
jgi:peptidoglycan/LPS O-acetylase OafA/YrhL